MKPKANSILDLSRMLLPLALLKATEAFRKLKPGETLEILTEDQETQDYLFKVIKASRYDLIEISEMGPVSRVLLKKI